MGIVSLIGLGKVPTVEFTFPSTLTTLPWIDNCPPLGTSGIYINAIRKEINLSSKGVKFENCGFTQNPFLFALQTGSFEYRTFRTSLLAQVLDRSHNS